MMNRAGKMKDEEWCLQNESFTYEVYTKKAIKPTSLYLINTLLGDASE